MKHLRPLFVLLLALCAGCQTFTLTTPTDFVRLDEPPPWAGGYDLRCASADGVVLAVRRVCNEEDASLKFWTKALTERLRQGQGYALLEEKPLSAASGEPGVQLRFGRDETNHPYSYWVTVFREEGSALGDSHLYVIEAKGKAEPFTQVSSEVTQAIESFEIN